MRSFFCLVNTRAAYVSAPHVGHLFCLSLSRRRVASVIAWQQAACARVRVKLVKYPPRVAPPPLSARPTVCCSPSVPLLSARGMASAHLEAKERKQKKKGKKRKGNKRKRTSWDIRTLPHSELPVFIVFRAFTYIALVADCISAMRKVRARVRSCESCNGST